MDVCTELLREADDLGKEMGNQGFHLAMSSVEGFILGTKLTCTPRRGAKRLHLQIEDFLVSRFDEAASRTRYECRVPVLSRLGHERRVPGPERR